MAEPTSDSAAAAEVARKWVADWNARDLEAIMSHYQPDVCFESPRVAAAWKATGGKVGSPDGVLLGVESLRPYFAQGIEALPNLGMDLQQVMAGPPGWWALLYTRETGAAVVETFQLRGTRIAAVRVFYEAVC